MGRVGGMAVALALAMAWGMLALRRRTRSWMAALLVAALVCLFLLRPGGNGLTERSSYWEEVIELPTLWYDGPMAGVVTEGGGNMFLGEVESGRNGHMEGRVVLGAVTGAWWFMMSWIAARSFSSSDRRAGGRPMGMAGGMILWVGVCVGLLGAGGCGKREGSPGRAQKAVRTSQPASAPAEEAGCGDRDRRSGRRQKGGVPRVGLLAGGVYRVQEETTTDPKAVPGLLRKVDAKFQDYVNRVETIVKALADAGVSAVMVRSGESGATSKETFSGGFMYWACPDAVDVQDALVVLVGTVEEIDHLYLKPRDYEPVLPSMYGTLCIEEILKVNRKACPSLPEKEWPVPGKHKWLHTGGTDGLWPGDTVVVLMAEYDGGLAIPPRRGGGCLIGAKLTGLHDPLLESIRYAVAHGMQAGLSHPVHGPRLKAIWAPWPEPADTPESQPE
ncbi:MAG: hypothetical protein NTV86_21845 [Planctomycetota bacterium]|nr:hypothetical protein [Planctomycetota bacterium]